MNRGSRLLARFLFGALILVPPKASSEGAPELVRWHCRLIEGSTLLDDCLVCGRPAIEIRLTGGFELVLTETNPLFSRYHLFDVRFTDGAEKPEYELTGEGSFEFGGEVALVQNWTLELEASTPAGRRAVVLKNQDNGVARPWPMMKVDLVEQDGTPFSRLSVTLVAAPFREIWFNTLHGMTSAVGQWPSNRIGSADILTDTGRVVRRGQALLAAVGLVDAGDDPDIDAFEVTSAASGKILFSLDRPVRSSIQGLINEGDVLAANGDFTVFRRYSQLLQEFGVMPPVPDLGLDAVQTRDLGELWFSIRTDAFSEKLGVNLGRGDILSDAGRVIRTNRDLLSRFNPAEAAKDLGLDGFYFWPSGEVWFATESGFQDSTLGAISDGDLLSDQGYLVARNLDLVREFQPLEDLANFGLQGLFLVTDTSPPPVLAPRLTRLERAEKPRIHWEGPGRVFQVEAAERLGDPFLPASTILPERSWEDGQVSISTGSRFYRVRSW